MNEIRSVLAASTLAFLLAMVQGCGPAPVPLSSTDRPELQKAVDKDTPEFKKLMLEATKIRRH